MPQITLLAPTGSAVDDVLADATRYQFVTVSADNLPSGATVTIEMVSGGTPVVVADPATSAARTLTPEVPAMQLAGGVSYLLSKSDTGEDVCGLYMNCGPGLQS